MILTDYLNKNADNYSLQNAIIYIDKNSLVKKQALTWLEFNELSNKIANYLNIKNIKHGDKIAIILPNCLMWIPILFGIMKIGATAVAINPNNTQEEIGRCFNLTDSKFAFISSELLYKMNCQTCFFNHEYCEVSCSEGSFINFFSEIQMCSSYYLSNNSSKNTPAVIYFSSGTTGMPKAVVISQDSIIEAAKTELLHHEQTNKDIFLCLSPLFHTGALVHWLGSFLVGGSIVFLKNTSPLNIVKTICNEKITIVWLPVPFISDLLDLVDEYPEIINSGMLNSLRLMHSGAQLVPSFLIKKWLGKFKNIKYDTNYGLTEATGPGCIYLGIDNMHKVGSIGKPDRLWQVRLVDESGNEVRRGNNGEIVLKGPGVMKEYYKDYDSTIQVIKNGWLYTGDIAYEDEDGFLYLVDRKKDIIISGGENIYPAHIEKFLRTNPKIKDVAVLGIENNRLGEVVAAVIELKSGQNCSQKEIQDFCLQIPYNQRPRRILFQKILKDQIGKVDKKAMKAFF